MLFSWKAFTRIIEVQLFLSLWSKRYRHLYVVFARSRKKTISKELWWVCSRRWLKLENKTKNNRKSGVGWKQQRLNRNIGYELDSFYAICFSKKFISVSGFRSYHGNDMFMSTHLTSMTEFDSFSFCFHLIAFLTILSLLKSDKKCLHYEFSE